MSNGWEQARAEFESIPGYRPNFSTEMLIGSQGMLNEIQNERAARTQAREETVANLVEAGAAIAALFAIFRKPKT